MNSYTITYDDGAYRTSATCPAPVELPLPGCRVRILSNLRTAAGVSYAPGDEAHLIRRTDSAPHYRRSSLGNWTVRCKYMVSVWTNIEWMIAIGHMEIIK